MGCENIAKVSIIVCYFRKYKMHFYNDVPFIVLKLMMYYLLCNKT